MKMDQLIWDARTKKKNVAKLKRSKRKHGKRTFIKNDWFLYNDDHNHNHNDDSNHNDRRMASLVKTKNKII